MSSSNGGPIDEGAQVPDALPRGKTPPAGVAKDTWDRITKAAQDKWRENMELSPSPDQSPDYVAATALKALRHNDDPYPNHGCEVAITFSSSGNPASSLSPSAMRAYLSDPALPFYRILSEWEHMDVKGDLQIEQGPEGPERAYYQVRLRRGDHRDWSTVNFDLVLELGCWRIERLWVYDPRLKSKSDRALFQELMAQEGNEALNLRFSDYNASQLVSWLEACPAPDLTPKMVALNALCALRANDIPYKNAGCELVARFCSPKNPASTLTPAHFATYLSEPWYQVIGEWDEVTFHSEELSEDGTNADLVVLLRRQREESWTSVNWELSLCDGVWLTDRIWVDDV